MLRPIDHAAACYVFFRLFPGLREPCDLARYVTLPDAEINTAMEAEAARWLDENQGQVMEKLRKQSQQRMGIGAYRNKPRSAPAERAFTFPVIARIAGWTYRECFTIGVGDGRWASARFPILVAENERDAVDICDGLNHRHRKHPDPNSPRFGWLPASAFPHDEQLDIGAKIVEAQSGMIHGEAKAAIHSLAAEALAFHESLQRSQPGSGDKQPTKTKTAKKRGPKGPRYDAESDRKIYDGWKSSGYGKKEDYARNVLKAATRNEIKKVLDAIEREGKRRRRKGRK